VGFGRAAQFDAVLPAERVSSRTGKEGGAGGADVLAQLEEGVVPREQVELGVLEAQDPPEWEEDAQADPAGYPCGRGSV